MIFHSHTELWPKSYVNEYPHHGHPTETIILLKGNLITHNSRVMPPQIYLHIHVHMFLKWSSSLNPKIHHPQRQQVAHYAWSHNFYFNIHTCRHHSWHILYNDVIRQTMRCPREQLAMRTQKPHWDSVLMAVGDARTAGSAQGKINLPDNPIDRCCCVSVRPLFCRVNAYFIVYV